MGFEERRQPGSRIRGATLRFGRPGAMRSSGARTAQQLRACINLNFFPVSTLPPASSKAILTANWGVLLQSYRGNQIGAFLRGSFLCLALALGAGALSGTAKFSAPATTSSSARQCRIVGLEVFTGGAVLTVLSPTNHYLARPVRGAGDQWSATGMGRLAKSPRHRGGSLPRTPGRSSGFFCGLAIDAATPADTDDDGIDDIYELLRSDVMNPLDPFDALEDADGDGVPNLEEYWRGTESALSRSTTAQNFTTLADLRQRPQAPLPALVHLGGYETEGDGWGGWFTWNPDDVHPEDDAIRVKIQPDRPGRLERLLQPDSEIMQVVKEGDPL